MVGQPRAPAPPAADNASALRAFLRRLMGGRDEEQSPRETPPAAAPRVVGYVAPGSRRIQSPDELQRAPTGAEESGGAQPPAR